MFVQTIEIRTGDVEAIERAVQEYEAATEGARTVRRSTLLQDRADPGRYLVVVEFDSAESAERNSELPATGALAAKIAELADAPLVFHDFDLRYQHH